MSSKIRFALSPKYVYSHSCFFKSVEEKHALRVNLEIKIESLWSQFQQSLESYKQTTDERKNQFEALRNKDQESARVIEMQMRKLQKLSVCERDIFVRVDMSLHLLV